MAMPRSISYSLASDAAELIDFEIEAYSIKKDEQTAARLEPVRPYFDERGEMAMQVKFVFNEQVYDAIEFEAYQAGSVNPLYRPARIMGEITESTAAPYYTTGSVAYVYSDAEDPGYHGLTILVPNTYPKPDPPYCAGWTLSAFVAHGAYWRFTAMPDDLPSSAAPLIITIP